MGNSPSCCTNNSPKEVNSNKSGPGAKYVKDIDIRDDVNITPGPPSSTNIQHISDREPDDQNDDPSLHPSVGPLFLERSQSEIHKRNSRSLRARNSHQKFNYHEGIYGTTLNKKFSSCSTIFLDDSTVSQPNLKNTIKAVALAIYFHIKNRQRIDGEDYDDRLLDIFDEKLHPLSKERVADDYAYREPEHKTIYRFIRTLFNTAQLTAECAIVMLVYLERLLTYADIEIVPANWKRTTLGAILLASKVWDDQAVWNVDFCHILKDISVEDMNELERQFLEMLQFNINVPSSVYAKYYFDLRALADHHDLSFPLEPLSKERASKLEAMSSVCEDKLRHAAVGNGKLKRSHSLDAVTGPVRTNSAAILS